MRATSHFIAGFVSPRHLAATTLLALLALGNGALGRADPAPCPAAIVQLTRGADSPFLTDVVVYDSMYVNTYTAHVAFDRTLARTSLTASSGGRLTASSRVVEQFDIVGVPPGTPVAAMLIFRVDGWSENSCGGSGCGVELEATLAQGASSVSADATQPGPGFSRRDIAATLSLPVVFIAGSPITAEFRLRYGTGPGGSAEGDVSGEYGVSGLPAGVRAVACTGADVTPVRHSTWGSLKRAYR